MQSTKTEGRIFVGALWFGAFPAHIAGISAERVAAGERLLTSESKRWGLSDGTAVTLSCFVCLTRRIDAFVSCVSPSGAKPSRWRWGLAATPELVADSASGLEPVRTQLGPQAADVDIDRARAAAVALAPDVAQ